MTQIPNPDDWMDVLTILVVTAMIAVPSWLSLRTRRTVMKMDKSISNGHTTPIRVDLDEVRDTLAHIRADLHAVKSELGDIRHELRTERKDRLELDHRFENYRRNA